MGIKEQSITLVSVAGMSSGDSRPSRTRLFVLSDVRLLREGLVLALSQQPSVLLVGSSDLSVPPTDIAQLRPDVVLLDATKRNNLERSSSLRQTVTGAKIVAFAVADSDEEVIACAEAGISGYISQRGSVEDVVAAVDAAVFGELHCSPRTSALLFSRIAQVCGKRDPLVGQEILTSREKEIVALVERGLSNKEIARSLRIGTATVKNHIHNILNKLDVRRRGEAAAWLRRANKGAPLMGVMLGVFSAATKVMDELWAGFCAEGLNSLVVALT